jgi:glycosyltransferase involved in cell wall biosynthesis
MKKSIALYDPYLDILGGGERYVLSILKVLEENNYEINIFHKENLQKKIEEKLKIDFNNRINFIDRKRSSKNYDIYLYVTDGSYQFSRAKKTYIYAMIPQKNLYEKSILNRIKTSNSVFITHSNFNRQHLKTWGIDAKLIYPYISNEYIEMDTDNFEKDKIILTVGRFFKHLHAKRQDVIINTFKKLKQEISLLNDFKLILAGGLKEEDKGYFEELKQLINGDPTMTLIANPTFADLLTLYSKSMMYWHFAGFNIDENRNPELAEHLGIAPLEAMASGCITFCYRAGGPKELILDGKNGFLFGSEEELKEKILSIIDDDEKQKDIRLTAKKYVKNSFRYEVFKKNVEKIIL